MSQIILKPIVTEKMTAAAEDMQRYGFLVKYDANKIEIKDAVEKLYGVNVEKVWTMRYAPKTKSRFTRKGVVTGKTAARKKAVVSVAKGETIDVYSNI